MPSNDMNFSLRISAIDATQAALRTAASGIARFARAAVKPITIPLSVGRGGLGLLRDINVGLVPLVRGVDGLVSRGARLNAVSQSFASLTRTIAGGRLAEQIQLASSGTLRLAEGMQLANRALASGLKFDQLLTAVEFISKKAATTGKDAGQALDTVITGLARGSTLFLDDFGILVDGAEGVKRSFDAIKGSGAFDQLGPAAQKAETVRQAVAEMQQQMGRIGVTGRESTFIFARMKSEIGDTADKLTAAVGRSKALEEAARVARDMLVGLRSHLENGGGFGELIFGKGMNGRGGLAGLASAGLRDIGANVGEGLKVAFLKSALVLVDAIDAGLASIDFKSWGSQFADGVREKLREGGGLLAGLFGGGTDEGAKAAASQPAASRPAASQPIAARSSSADADIALAAVAGFGSNTAEVVKGDLARVAAGAGIAAASRLALKEIASTDATAVAVQTRDSMGRYIPRLAGDVASAGIPKPGLAVQAARGAMSVGTKASGILTVADFTYNAYELTKEVLLLRDAMKELREAEEHLASQRRNLAIQQGGGPLGFVMPRTATGQMESLLRSIRNVTGGGLGAVRRALMRGLAESKAPGFTGVAAAAQEVQEEFGAKGGETREDRRARRDQEKKKAEERIPLTDEARRKLLGEYGREIEKLRGIEQSDKTREEAIRRTRRQAEELRRGGHAVGKEDYDRLLRRNFRDVVRERQEPHLRRIKELAGELNEDGLARNKKQIIKGLNAEQAGEDLAEFAARIEASIMEMIQAMRELMGAIVGGNQQLKRAVG